MPTLKRFDPDTASESYFRSRHEYLGLRLQEEAPDDPNMPLEFSINNARGWKLIETLDFEMWHLWEGEKTIAELFLIVSLGEDNPHLMSVELQILQPYRRRGYTKPLLEKTLTFAGKHGRTLLTGRTNSFVPEGQGFAERVGATCGLASATNQLLLGDVDRGLLSQWVNSADAHFEMGFWGSRYPDADLHAVAELFNVMNTAPRDELNREKTSRQRLKSYAEARLMTWLEGLNAGYFMFVIKRRVVWPVLRKRTGIQRTRRTLNKTIRASYLNIGATGSANGLKPRWFKKFWRSAPLSNVSVRETPTRTRRCSPSTISLGLRCTGLKPLGSWR